jgi:hypothetical protein
VKTTGRQAQVDFIGANAARYAAGWGDKPLETFDGCTYQALAAAAIHPDAYLFTKKNVPWGSGSAWEQHEYWALTHNPNIMRIWRVDPRPPYAAGIPPLEICAHSAAELLWDRDAGDPVMEPRWECPVV